jgi:hypothetical protein
MVGEIDAVAVLCAASDAEEDSSLVVAVVTGVPNTAPEGPSFAALPSSALNRVPALLTERGHIRVRVSEEAADQAARVPARHADSPNG